MAFLGLGAADAGASVLPVGVQLGVSQNTVHNVWGWTECYSDSGTANTPLAGILAGCSADYLMLGVRNSQGDYEILAAAEYADVTFGTGVQTGSPDVSHTANGSEWYFSTGWSWGFSQLGNAVELNSCDVNLSGQNNIGMCWHTGGGNLTNGWAFNDGAFQGYTGYQRVILTGLSTVPEPAALGLFGLGLVGLGLAARRRRTA